MMAISPTGPDSPDSIVRFAVIVVFFFGGETGKSLGRFYCGFAVFLGKRLYFGMSKPSGALKQIEMVQPLKFATCGRDPGINNEGIWAGT
jgi:hypothetical protein